MRPKKPTSQSRHIVDWTFPSGHGRAVHVRADINSRRVRASLRVNGSVVVYLRNDQLKPVLDHWKLVLADGTPASSLIAD